MLHPRLPSFAALLPLLACCGPWLVSCAESTDGPVPDAATPTADAEPAPDNAPPQRPLSPEELAPEPEPDVGLVDAAPDPCGDGREALAAELRLSEVALYQGVKVQLSLDGEAAEASEVPIVAGRDALVRAFVVPRGGWERRPVTAVLTLDQGDHVDTYVAPIEPEEVSEEGFLFSTANFEVQGQHILPYTRVSVSLQETQCTGNFGDPAIARFPAEGGQPINAELRAPWKVVLVPIRYRAGGVDISPDTSDEFVEEVRQRLYSVYPVPEVQVSVREPLEWTFPIGPRGNGWPNLLEAVLAQRRADGVAPDVFYYGLIRSADRFRDYCPGGCVLGLAPQTDVVVSSLHAGLGIGYRNEAGSIDTMVHEMGHAHGRLHTDCGSPDAVDRNYPYEEGKTGVWGYDPVERALMSPVSHDFMGYCPLVWVSDYTYIELARRRRAIELDAARASSIVGPGFRSLLINEDGSTRWGRGSLPSAPSKPLEAVLLNAEGAQVGGAAVAEVALSHVATPLLYVSGDTEGATTLVAEDGRRWALP